ncbi:hypothetical protein MNBD_PLANCTO02-2215, partial [hydrothermal vent metagenome]
PRQATVTKAACSETAELKATLESNRLYVTDRGYQDQSLFKEIIDADSSFISRVKDNITYEVQKECAITEEAKAAGVVRDVVLSMVVCFLWLVALKRMFLWLCLTDVSGCCSFSFCSFDKT